MNARPKLMPLFRIEIRKLTSTPAAFVGLGVAVALTATSVVTNLLLAGREGAPALGSVANAEKVLAVAAVSSMVMLVLGILSTAGEYRHRTILSTYLAEPRRGRVLTAKLVVIAVLGALVGAATYGLALAITIPFYAAHGVHLPFGVSALWLGASLVGACYGLLGAALGALTGNTVAAVLGGLAWVQIVEVGLLQNIWPEVAKWLPTGAGVALTGSATPVPGLLNPAVAAAVLLGWVAVIALTATRVSMCRELR